MKKILFGLITLVATLVSCTDQEDIEIATNQGEPLAGKDSLAGQEFLNRARRIMGEPVSVPELSQEEGLLQRLKHILRKNSNYS